MQGLDGTARAILRWQILLAGVSALIFTPLGGEKILASLSGSAIAIIPTGLIYLRARYALRAVGARDPRMFVRQLYRAQATKYALTLVLFALVMANLASHFIQIMAGYLASAAAYWIVMGRAGLRD